MARPCATASRIPIASLAFLLAACATPPTPAPTPSPPSPAELEAEVLAAHATWYRSYLPDQQHLLRDLLAPDFMNVTATGRISGTDEILDDAWDDRVFRYARPYETLVRLLAPDAAVVTGAAELGWMEDDVFRSARYRYTHVLKRQVNGWRMVHAQHTKIPSRSPATEKPSFAN